MNIALVSGLIILILLVIMLIAGVPIAVALGISSVVAILPIMDLEVAVVTGAQRIFSGISMFSLLAIPFFILAGNIMNKGGIAVRLINLAKLITGRAPGAPGTDQRDCQHAVWRILRLWHGCCFRHGFHHRPHRKRRRL